MTDIIKIITALMAVFVPTMIIGLATEFFTLHLVLVVVVIVTIITIIFAMLGIDWIDERIDNDTRRDD